MAMVSVTRSLSAASAPLLTSLSMVCETTRCIFALLALAQERHFGRFYLLFRPLKQRIYGQLAIGIIAICLALPVCLKTQGAGFGSLLWFLMLTASAMMVALQLTWVPQLFKPLAWLVKRLFMTLLSTI